MIRFLKSLLRPSSPTLTASSWFSVFVVAALMVAPPPLTSATSAAYPSGGDADAAPTKYELSLWDPVGALLKMVAGKTGGKSEGDARKPERQGKLVGLQAGHWRYWESPPPLNAQSGGSSGGVNEHELTLDVAQRTAGILEDMGYKVEILPAWFERGYTADVVVAIHSDGAANPEARGFFSDRYANSAAADTDDQLMSVLNSSYDRATGIPFKYRSTTNSRYYYGFALVKPKTPMALIETGFLTNEQDREIIVKNRDRVAEGIANGIDEFLMR